MATDFNEKERAFVEALKPETGLDLPAWMAAIAASGLIHRNDVIDWLRQQGFTFAHASWLERIHHNGGRLIYGGNPPKPPPAARPQAKSQAKTQFRSVPSRRTASTEAEIDAVLAAAKAYRPLAQLVLRDALAAVPGADAAPFHGYIVVSHGRPFAALLPQPRDVRLMLALGPCPSTGWEKPKFSGSTLETLAGLTHMKVLTDAREVDAQLRELILQSARNCR